MATFVDDDNGYIDTDSNRIVLSRMRADPVRFHEEFCRKMKGKQSKHWRANKVGDNYSTLDPTLWNKLQRIHQGNVFLDQVKVLEDQHQALQLDEQKLAIQGHDANLRNLHEKQRVGKEQLVESQNHVAYGMFWYRFEIIKMNVP